MKQSPKSASKKPSTKKAKLDTPIKKSGMTTAKLAANHNETLVHI